MKANQDLREIMFSSNVSQWEVAKTMNISESTLSRLLREELRKEKKTEIRHAIMTIVYKRQGINLR